MRYTFAILCLIFSMRCLSQTTDTIRFVHVDNSDIASFVTTLDTANATKDGIYLNGYVVNISYKKAKKLHGKKIRVTGKVSTIKGLKKYPNSEIQQGREEDFDYIESPKIKVLKD